MTASFLGGLDTQQLLPNGSPAEVREGVRQVLKATAPGGGYIFMPGHYVNADVPFGQYLGHGRSLARLPGLSAPSG